jgi:hypothetical protein
VALKVEFSSIETEKVLHKEVALFGTLGYFHPHARESQHSSTAIAP